MKLGGIEVILNEEKGGIRVLFGRSSTFFSGADLESLSFDIQQYFVYIRQAYGVRTKVLSNLYELDGLLDFISLRITIVFLNVTSGYISTPRKKPVYRMEEASLSSGYAFDEIYSVIKDAFPNEWETIMAHMLNMDADQFAKFCAYRFEYYRK